MVFKFGGKIGHSKVDFGAKKKELFCDISKMNGRRAGTTLIMRLQIIDGCFRQIHHVSFVCLQ